MVLRAQCQVLLGLRLLQAEVGVGAGAVPLAIGLVLLGWIVSESFPRRDARS